MKRPKTDTEEQPFKKSSGEVKSITMFQGGKVKNMRRRVGGGGEE